jgi:hypothetical protein
MRRCNGCDRLLESRYFRLPTDDRCNDCRVGRSTDDLNYPGEDKTPPRWWQERAARAPRRRHGRAASF